LAARSSIGIHAIGPIGGNAAYSLSVGSHSIDPIDAHAAASSSVRIRSCPHQLQARGLLVGRYQAPDDEVLSRICSGPM
jgi:hypothetical protein